MEEGLLYFLLFDIFIIVFIIVFGITKLIENFNRRRDIKKIIGVINACGYDYDEDDFFEDEIQVFLITYELMQLKYMSATGVSIKGYPQIELRFKRNKILDALQKKDYERYKLIKKIMDDIKYSFNIPYQNHCWNCSANIDSLFNKRCPTCHWYICSNCGSSCNQGKK